MHNLLTIVMPSFIKFIYSFYIYVLEISFLVLHLLPGREKIMTVPRKTKKREARREEKAEKAAILDKVLFPVLFYFSD